VTVVNATPDVTIRKNDKTSGKTISPYDGLHTTAASDNTTVRVWGDDGDGSPDYFTTEAGAVYYITIPAGIVKNAAGTLNDEIVITWNGPAAPKNVALVSATPADGTVLGTNADMTVELKFDAAVTIANAKPSVELLKDDKTMGDKISPANGWHATAASDNTTIRVWGDDGDGAVDYFKTEEGAEYYLVIPAGIVKDASGNANAEITLKWNGPAAKKALTVVSTTPADGSTYAATWVDMAFNITFNDDITILDYGPDAVLREGDATTGTKVEPDLYWKAVKEDSKTLRIWGSDYDYAVQTFQPKEGVKYYMTIPAGIVQNESGSKNEQIVIMVNGPEAAKAGLTVVGTTPADGSSIDSGYQDMKLYVTFSEDITVVKTAPAVVMRKNDATTGSIVEPMGYWRAQRSGTTKLYIWGDDGDGYTDTYNVEDGVMYYVTIPAGVVKNSAGTLNDEIVFEFCGASTSGINGISAENGAVEVARYDINGRRVGENHKGMTVVRFSDGTVSKLFVK
jgi:WD40 repeat protein